MQCAAAGCSGAPTVLASGRAAPQGIAVRGGTVYWVDHDGGTLAACAVGGCGGAPTTLASGLLDPTEIAVDGAHVYVAEYGTGAGDGRVIALAR
jgi:hypothetical protein